MSGGHFDYRDMALKDAIFGYSSKPKNVFEDLEISRMVWDMLDLIHAFDWYICGDTGEESWLKAKAEFKQKWLGAPEDRVRRIIDASLDEMRKEIYKTYGIVQEKDAQDGS